MPKDFSVFSVDTDAITVCKKSGDVFSPEEQESLIQELNSMYPDQISWELDGTYDAILVVKTKNYALKLPDGKIKIHGSGLKCTMKEKALRTFLHAVIGLLIEDKKDDVINLYHDYVKKILTLTDITDWCSKKTITKSVLNPKRTTESNILGSIKDDPHQEGDKIFVYFCPDGSLKQAKNWNNDHSVDKLLKKLHDTVCIFETVIDKKLFINYSLKTKRKFLDEINICKVS